MNKGYHDFAKYGGVGISWVLSTSIYLYLGFKAGAYLDERFGSSPLFLLGGLLLAIGLSLKTLVTEIIALTKALDRPDKPEDPSDRRAPDREKNNNP